MSPVCGAQPGLPVESFPPCSLSPGAPCSSASWTVLQVFILPFPPGPLRMISRAMNTFHHMPLTDLISSSHPCSEAQTITLISQERKLKSREKKYLVHTAIRWLSQNLNPYPCDFRVLFSHLHSELPPASMAPAAAPLKPCLVSGLLPIIITFCSS